MRTIVSKEVTFDCAHMLSGHSGLCANLHGHTYKVQVLIEDAPINQRGTSSDQMVIDFKDLKQCIQDEIVQNFDHAVIFSNAAFRSKPEQELYEWARKNKMRHYVMPKRTTAECMAEHFTDLLFDAFLEKGVQQANMPKHIGVRVWETPTSCAEVIR